MQRANISAMFDEIVTIESMAKLHYYASDKFKNDPHVRTWDELPSSERAPFISAVIKQYLRIE